MKPYLLALVAALAVVLAHEPFHVWPLAYVGLAVLAHLTWDDALSSRRRGLALMFAGAVYFGVGCHWLLETAWFNWIGMTVPEALTFPAAALIARRMRAFVPRLPRAFVFAIAFGAVEYVRARFPFNGYPWFLIGATQPASMAQVVALIGTSGLGLVLAFAGGSLREFVARRREPAALALHAAAFLVCVGGLFAYSTFCVDVDETAQALGARTRVALVQGNISQQLKHAPKTEREILTVQLRGTRAALAKAGERGFDLLCWAETMFPYPMAHDDAPGTWFTSGFGTDDARAIEREFVAGDLMRGTLKDAHASLLLGAITCSGATPRERADHNSALLFDAEGVRRGRYSKTLLVPGGEFIPLRSILPAVVDRWVEDAAGFLPRLAPGDGPRPFVLRRRDGSEATFATTICYENVYPGYAAAVGALDVDFVVNLSNEGWFGVSSEFDQMEAASILRAIEMRTPVVRATNTGISAIYDAYGRRVAVLTDGSGKDRGIEGVLIADVPPRPAGKSAFVRMGELPAWLATLATLVGFIGGCVRAGYFRRPRF